MSRAEELADALEMDGWEKPSDYQVADELRRLSEIERQYLALKASIGDPVAWGLFAQVEDGVFHLQHPVRFTENDAMADRPMYDRTTQIRIHPLYAIKDKQP